VIGQALHPWESKALVHLPAGGLSRGLTDTFAWAPHSPYTATRRGQRATSTPSWAGLSQDTSPAHAHRKCAHTLGRGPIIRAHSVLSVAWVHMHTHAHMQCSRHTASCTHTVTPAGSLCCCLHLPPPPHTLAQVLTATGKGTGERLTVETVRCWPQAAECRCVCCSGGHCINTASV
jgi:hypothetical protein